ncbi:MAG: transposase [Acidobacteriia bacterium]|nr:transposase [Terriglobia bacterium]
MFLDETGFLMAPRVCRTWAPRSHTPVFYQRGGSYQKVSCIGALVVPPGRHSLHFYFRLHPDHNINTDRALGFLTQLLRQLQGNLLVIWDGAGPHLARKVEAFLYRHLRLYLEYLPPCAPELNPVEYVWSYLKKNPLAHCPATTLSSLTDTARRSGQSLQRQPRLLRSFLKHSSLFLRLK